MRLPIFLSVLSAAAPVTAQATDEGHGGKEAKAAVVTDDGPKLVVETFASAPTVKNITAICFDNRGDLYVAETYRFRHGIEDNRNHRYWLMDDIRSQTNADRRAMYAKWKHQFADPEYFTRYSERVLRLRDTDGDGKSDEATVFADGFNSDLDGPAIGLLAHTEKPGHLHLTCIPHLWRLNDVDGDGKAEIQEPLISGFGPKVSLSGHDLHGLVWGPDGKIYFSVGDRGFNIDEGKFADVNSGAAFRCHPDGTGLEVFYHQLRNPQELAFNEFGDLFTVDNNCDQGDAARVCYLIEGGNAGWTIGTQHLTTFAEDIEAGGLGDTPFWMSEKLWETRFEGQPAWILPPLFHLTNGPSGLLYNSGISLPERYRNHFLVCDYKGSSAQSFLYSFKALREGAGYRIEDPHIFHKGVTNTDVTLGPDGKIYLADYGGGWTIPNRGAIYALSVPETLDSDTARNTAKILDDGFGVGIRSLVGLLSHPDMRVRLRAQFEIVSRSPTRISHFAGVARNESQNLFARLHAIWGLRQLKRASTLRDLASSPVDEVRAQAAKALGDLRDERAVDILVNLLADPAPRVRTFAAIAVGKIGDPSVLGAAVRLLEENADKDLFVRHGGVMALTGTATPEKLEFLRKHASPSVRLAAVLALRRQKSALVGSFLKDADPTVRDEAIRAINDVPIPGALPLLGDLALQLDDSKLSRPLFRRLLNANLRSNHPLHTLILAETAANTRLPNAERLLALRFLENWLAPPPIDPTMGEYRPLPARDAAKAEAAKLIAPALDKLFDEGGTITAQAVRVAGRFGIAMDRTRLAGWMADTTHDASVRVAAIQRLADARSPDLESPLKTLMEDDDAAVREAAGTAWKTLFPARSLEAALALLLKGGTQDARAAYGILAESPARGASALILSELGRLEQGTVSGKVALDLYNAATNRKEASVVQALKTLDERLASQGRTAMHFAMRGGDADRGKNVFFNQGICLKCHVVGRQGGQTGPALSDLALRKSRSEIFKAVVDPNADIVPGYGICTVRLKDGPSISGTPVMEDATHLYIKAGAEEPEKIAKSQIAERTPTISPMPPFALSKSELRDLMEYLSQRTTPNR